MANLHKQSGASSTLELVPRDPRDHVTTYLARYVYEIWPSFRRQASIRPAVAMAAWPWARYAHSSPVTMAFGVSL